MALLPTTAPIVPKTGGVTTPATIAQPAPTYSTGLFNVGGAPLGSQSLAPKATATTQYSSPIGPQLPVVKTPTGTTDYAKTAAAINTATQANKTTAVNLSNTQTTSANNITSSSAPVVAAENQTKTDVASLTAPNTGEQDARDASKKYTDQLQSEYDALEKRRQEEVDRITKDFEGRKVALADQQNREKGTYSVTLSRIGGYLGNSASSTGAMITLNQQHTAEMNSLEAKKAQAIQEANNAVSDKQFALARLKVQEVKDLEKTINDRKNKYFDDQIKLNNEIRNQSEFQAKQITDNLKAFSSVDINKVPPEKLAEIDSFYGVPGFAKNYLDVTSKATQAKSQKDIIETQKSMLELLQNIPAGKELQFPDGTSYTGIGKAGDVATFMQTDSSGAAHLVTYNKLTGAKSITPMGYIGKGSGGSGGSASSVPPAVRDNVQAKIQMTLEQTKDKNGQYDPDTYVALRQELKGKYPQLLSQMDKLFLNKDNDFFSDTAINRLRKKGIYYGDSSLPPDSISPQQQGDTVTEGQ